MSLNDRERTLIQTCTSVFSGKERSDKPFDQILGFFLHESDLDGKDVLDLGPGHYHFGELARKKGASVSVIESDSALAELGKHKGFEVIQGDIKKMGTLLGGRQFDGIFCKYGFSALWSPRAEDQIAFSRTVRRALKDGGWAWFAPWNGGALLAGNGAGEVLRAQIEAFESHGFSSTELSLNEAKRFGLHGITGNRVLFTLGLDYPELSNSGAKTRVSPATIVRTLSDSTVAHRNQRRSLVSRAKAAARRIIRAVAGPYKKA